ncbi:hypothetical protein A2851_03425 [Candidatus Kaiserbacteria bacterium RIFCSPHIGHO2_01_FULL_53_29]|uniref:Uncharacterized protein n=1 Tax=Candidatus Kaiserbacteria bacterium RIFCSPHIGHO2_01_FULL_53_29 TaxID=1798480 RepID=A0A1F6CXM8_9BACT|nr:MAG: hypothetical protein A2851_03425 [Candidatus Kaiserbacteria bacterium RIFCSPHIGHO2_01_FULL_53_29]
MTKKKNIGFRELDAKLDRVIDVLVTKVDNSRIDELEKRIDLRFEQVMTAIDGLATAVHELTLEYAAVKTQLARHEEWFKILAKKTGVKLPI